MNDLDARARAVLQSFRVATSPGKASREAGLAAVEARIVANANANDDDVEPTDAARERPSAIFVVRAAAISVAIAAAVLLAIRTVAFGVATLAADVAPAHDAASDTPQLERAPGKADSAQPTAAPPIEPVPVAAIVPAAPSAPPPISAPAQRRDAPARADDALQAELSLILAAKQEADAAAALVLLDRHVREFPKGALARERDVLRAERLCTVGRTADARALAKRFLVDRATDPLALRMRTVCHDD